MAVRMIPPSTVDCKEKLGSKRLILNRGWALISYNRGLMSSQTIYEIRDPIHATIRIDHHERRAVDSAPVQRLRYIRQLGLTYLLYPGACHSRFEHSLGA